MRARAISPATRRSPLPSIGASLALAIAAAEGAPTTILESDFTGTAPGSNTPWTNTSALDPSLTFSGWSRGPGANAEAGIDDAFGFSVVAGSDAESTLAAAIADNEYLTCTVAPSGGGSLNLNGLQVNLGIQRRAWWAPRRYAFFTSVGGFAEGQELFTSPVVSNGNYDSNAVSFFLPATGYDNLVGPLEIRVFAYTGRYAGHDTSVDAFSLVTGVGTSTLTVNAGAGGSAASIPDSSTFVTGETAQLTATPDAGYRFAGWSGDLVGFGNPRAITMDADKTVTAHFEMLPAPDMVIGTNLGTVTDWTSAWIFKDLFKRIRAWMTRNADGSGSWSSDKTGAIPLDADGWPTQIPFDPGDGSPMQMVHTILVSSNDAGPHTLFYEGAGSFRIRTGSSGWSAPVADGTPRTHAMQIGRRETVTLEITASGPTPNHLRNFRLVPDEFVDSSETKPFHPLYLEKLKPFDHLRFMDWGRTNGSGLVSWADRTRPEHPTQARWAGASLEMMILLCNTLGCDAWFCIPHRADDDYVTQFATLIRDTLDPDLLAYIEYSNETWNGIFSQTNYVQDQGQALGLDANRWQAGQEYVSLRSAQIWKICEDVFGAAAPDRLVKVLATQSSSISITNTRVAALNDPAINPDMVFADALAIAPYFGHNFPADEIPPTAPAYPTVDDIVTTYSLDGIVDQRNRVGAQKASADTQGWDLICYEGGQHYTGLGAAQNDTTLTGILTGANGDLRMYKRYEEYLDMLQEEGVSVFSHYLFVGGWSKFGSWGSAEELDQEAEDAPKFAAVSDWMDINMVGLPVFGPTALGFSGVDDLELTFRSKPATQYRIDTSPDLRVWTPAVPSVDSDGLSTTVTLPGAAAGPRIFVRPVELD